MTHIIDTSALVALSGIRRLDLLRGCCGRVAVPTAVRAEVVDQGVGWVEAADARDAILNGDWLFTMSVAPSETLRLLRTRLGAGEAECLELGRVFGVPVIVDDQRARREGERLGISITGSLGMMAKSKKLGLIDHVAPLIGEIRGNGIYLSDQRMADFLKELGELP